MNRSAIGVASVMAMVTMMTFAGLTAAMGTAIAINFQPTGSGRAAGVRIFRGPRTP
jgi:hypothetical protein